MAEVTESGLSPSETSPSEPNPTDTIHLGVIGGQTIICEAIQYLLRAHGIGITDVFRSEADLADSLQADDIDCDVLLLILSGGPFTTFHRIRDILSKTHGDRPLVVLSEQASRGQIYTALRIGAKAYVNLDDDAEELVKAIKMASANKVYLAPDAAELLVSDISTTSDGSGANRLPSVQLSRREVEIVQLLCEGLSSKEIGRQLHISSKTVENHRYNIYKKCEVDSIAGLMRHAIQQGLISI